MSASDPHEEPEPGLVRGPDTTDLAGLPSAAGASTEQSAAPTEGTGADQEGGDEGVGLEDEPLPAWPEPYVFSTGDVPHAARVLDAAFNDPLVGWDGWGAVENAVEHLKPPLSEGCVRVLGQLAARPLKLELRGRPRAELAVDADSILPAVGNVDNNHVALWEALVDQVAVPAAVARLNDLLFLRRTGSAGDHAHRAARAYLDAVGGRTDDMDITTYLLRAWAVCRLIKAVDIENDVLDEIERRVDAFVAGDGAKHPGVLHPLVMALCEKPLDTARIQPLHNHANAVLRTLAGMESRGHLASSIASMRRKLASGTDLADINADEVNGHLRHADASPNVPVRMLRLQKAAQIATRRRLIAQARDITAKM